MVALEVPIVYNVYGEHDPNDLMFALKGNVAFNARSRPPQLPHLLLWPITENENALKEYAENFVSPDPFIPSVKAPKVPLNPLVRPLVLRCNLHDTVSVTLENQIRKHAVGMLLWMDMMSDPMDLLVSCIITIFPRVNSTIVIIPIRSRLQPAFVGTSRW